MEQVDQITTTERTFPKDKVPDFLRDSITDGLQQFKSKHETDPNAPGVSDWVGIYGGALKALNSGKITHDLETAVITQKYLLAMRQLNAVGQTSEGIDYRKQSEELNAFSELISPQQKA